MGTTGTAERRPVFGFRTRWRLLRPLLDPAISMVFGRDVAARVRALKHAAEETDLLRRFVAG